jgi:hypothetical protein
MKTSFSLVLLALSIQANAATTNEDIACIRKDWIEDIVKFAEANDIANVKSYLNNGQCLHMKEGLQVTVTNLPEHNGGVTGFVFHGVKMWTRRGGINY